MKLTTLFLIAIIFTFISVMPIQAQEDETVVRIATFGRHSGLIAKDNSLRVTIRENNEELVPEQIEVRAIDQIIIAIDNSDSMKYILEDLIKRVKKCLPESLSQPMAIITFNEQFDIVANFTYSKEDLKNALDRVDIKGKCTKIFDALLILQQMAAERTTHIIMITDGRDTSEKALNIKQLLSGNNLSFSYLNWGYVDPSLKIDEPGYQSEKKSRLIKATPNKILSKVVKRSGGKLINIMEWDNLTDYLTEQFQSGKYLYRFFWYSNNPENKYQIVTESSKDRILARN